MTPHHRRGLAFCAACFALGGATAAVLHYAGVSVSMPRPKSGAIARIELPPERFDKLASLTVAPTPEPSPSETPEPSPTPSQTPTPSPTPEPKQEPTPAPQFRPTSVFGADRKGSLSCRIPGRSDFLVEWDSARQTAVAHFSGSPIAGTMARERNTANWVESRLAFALEDAGHSFAMTIDDAGAMHASVDGRESAGTCTRS